MTPSGFARIYERAFPESRPWSAAEFEDILSSKHSFYVGDSRGFAVGRVIAGESELITLAVEPKFQGQGFGRRLLKLYQAEALKLGAESYFLEVASDNKTAINLYISDGYSVSSSRPNY
ncbi:GNAT family N-acetyltransferase [Cognatishimia activa]|uniref:GNAT family N-acetyltransferase n=1 Tax=Cognatishimia activa TaxID=1715691 RepID=UPI00222E3555|nr:GNAT family N-acetyltransferase [Cognatishimia activa]UZD90132.1 GNAT family N-acetyltransferase [Cognatishimia activa]